jgi:hypothetical protein
MPALPSKQTRRKGATPITKLHQDDVWCRILDVMGLEPLSSNHASPTATNTEAAEAMASPTAAPAPGTKKITILDLPSETQKDIFKHVSIPDPEVEVVMRQMAWVQC